MDAARVLKSREWTRSNRPFPYIHATNVFKPDFYANLSGEFREILSKGLSTGYDPARFSRTMKNTEAYGWHFPAAISGSLAFFYSAEWHRLLEQVMNVQCTGHVSASLHHHEAGSDNAPIHQDLNLAYYAASSAVDGITRMDLTRCRYFGGATSDPGQATERVVRAITMIFYLENTDWNSSKGGETGLFASLDAKRTAPAKKIPPIDNSLILFENRPGTYHCSLPVRQAHRNSVVLWLHREEKEVRSRWNVKF